MLGFLKVPFMVLLSIYALMIFMTLSVLLPSMLMIPFFTMNSWYWLEFASELLSGLGDTADIARKYVLMVCRL